MPLSERYQAANDRSAEHFGRTTIAEVEWFLYDRRADRDRGPVKPSLAVRVTADDGAEGACDLPLWNRREYRVENQQGIESTLLGRDPFDREGIWESLYAQQCPLFLLSCVDVALWDLFGRVEGQPVHALLGTQRDQVKAYRSTQFNIGPPGDLRGRRGAHEGARLAGVQDPPLSGLGRPE